MKILDRWRLGAYAMTLASAVRDALRNIDAAALMEALAQVIRLERATPKPGSGEAKWDALADWFIANWPQYAERIDTLALVVRAAVALYNALGVFRTRSA